MKPVARFALTFASGLVCVAMSAEPAHAAAQEVFICKIKEGKTVADLAKVGSEFRAAIGDLKGGADYQATILTPIASRDLSNIVWVGEMPDFSALAAFNDEYNASDVGKKFDAKFQAIADCQSRSFWQVIPVE